MAQKYAIFQSAGSMLIQLDSLVHLTETCIHAHQKAWRKYMAKIYIGPKRKGPGETDVWGVPITNSDGLFPSAAMYMLELQVTIATLKPGTSLVPGNRKMS